MDKAAKRKPMYMQIKDYMFDQIKQKRWEANYRLPSENELAKQFNVSNITVKNALSQLAKGGLIYRVQGKGSFVSGDQPGEPVLFESMTSSSKVKPYVAFLMPRLNSLHTASLLDHIESELARMGYHLLFRKTGDSQELEREILREVIEIGVKGIIIFPVDGETYSDELMRLTLNNFPLVVVDRYLRGIETNCVYSDNIGGAHLATSHLISLGHRHIGFISTPYRDTSSIEDRLFGYEKALKENYIPIDLRLQNFDIDVKQICSMMFDGIISPVLKEQIKVFIQTNPQMTAIFAGYAFVGIAVLQVAEELGLAIPQDFSVIFFDNENLRFSRFPPTYINQPEKELGIEAARLLVSIMEYPGNLDRQKLVLPTQLMIGTSTGPCPMERLDTIV